MIKTITSIVVLLVHVMMVHSQTSNTMKLINDKLDLDWYFRQDMENADTWHKATVPGCVHTDLIRDSIIADPFLGINEKNAQWIGEASWIYRCEEFNITPEVLGREVIRLKFNGL